MPDQNVPVVRTPINVTNYTQAAVRAWHVVGAGIPTKGQIGVLFAQYMIETGGRDAWNFNLGNSKDVRDDGIDYQMLGGVWEGFPKTVADAYVARGEARYDTNPGHIAAVAPNIAVVFDPPHPMTWFSAFKSLEQAMEYHLKFLAKKRYASAWPSVLSGEPIEFAKALKAKGYFTASAEAYAAGMAVHFKKFMASDAYEKAVAGMVALQSAPSPEAPADESSDTEPPPPVEDNVVMQPDLATFVEVECNGERWLVSPMYCAPVGIGEALELARGIGLELPSPDLVDAIYAAADLKIDAERMIFTKKEGSDFTARTMDAPETHGLTMTKLLNAIGERRFGVDYKLIAGAFKDVVVQDGKLGVYGWQRLSDGKPIQGRGADGKVQTGHDLTWRDYSQGARYVKRIG